MKSVPLKALKENLSTWIENAHNGNWIQITKHNKPYVFIVPVNEPGLLRGEKVGTGELKPLFDKKTKGRYLKYLLEDRED